MYPGSFNDSDPSQFTKVGPRFFFSAYAAGTQYELYKSNGTAAGTKLVEEINAGGFMGSSPADLTNVGSKLMFTADDARTAPSSGSPTAPSGGPSSLRTSTPLGARIRATC